MYVGTYSDSVLIDKIKQEQNSEYVNLTDDEIQKEVIEKGKFKNCITFFFAKNLNDAIKQAKQMNLKNFCPVSNLLYEKGKHY